jgi:pyruvate/2-oxoglutarate dehydrogenase complex dihydrolipoamide dehydrogenase (E3) component
MDTYDLVVIGGGSGGLTAAIIGGRLGAKVLLVDKTDLGGDCLHWGCVPSKALIASSRLAQRMRRAAEFGLAPVEVKANIAQVMARIRSIKDTIGASENVEALAAHGVEVAFGGATFEDPHVIRIGANDAHPERRVEARYAIIATGSHAAPPPIAGLAESGFLDHVSVFQLESHPGRLVVIGGGPVGCELGQALSRLGSDVTILQRGDRLLGREMRDASALVAEHFGREGIDVRLSTDAVRVERVGDERLVFLRDHSAPLRCDAVLVAVGRRPTLAGLGLDAAGVEHTAKGITVDDALRTSRAHIFAVGDCNGGPQFTHWAEKEARVAARNALFKGTDTRKVRNIPAVTFTEPEVAHVGPTLAEAQKTDPDAHAHRVPFSHVDRAVCDGDSAGFIEVVVDKKDRVLGAHIVGPEAGEVLTEWVMAIEHGISLPQIGELIHAYPTLSRANRRVADERFLAHGLSGVSGWIARLAANFSAQ